VQVDPIKFKLKAPETNILKQKCVEPLSRFAFRFNLRRYTQRLRLDRNQLKTVPASFGGRGLHLSTSQLNRSRSVIQLTPSTSLKLTVDNPLYPKYTLNPS
jgi:hypothetical protein